MHKEDIDILYALFVSYNYEEFIATIAELCHSMTNSETKTLFATYNMK